MQAIKDFDKVQIDEEFKRLPAGGYVVKITDVQDKPENEYLMITYDIAEGEYKDHFKATSDDYIFTHQFIRSYKATALGMFKGFIKAVEDSNKSFKWSWDEKKLIGKLLGVVFGEEEYENNRGEIKTALRVKTCKTVDAIRKGDFKTPEPKKITPKAGDIPAGFTALTDADLPF